MTMGQATREAIRRFGKGSRCQSYPGGRRLQVPISGGGRLTSSYPPGTEWERILDAESARRSGRPATSPEGT